MAVLIQAVYEPSRVLYVKTHLQYFLIKLLSVGLCVVYCCTGRSIGALFLALPFNLQPDCSNYASKLGKSPATHTVGDEDCTRGGNLIFTTESDQSSACLSASLDNGLRTVLSEHLDKQFHCGGAYCVT